MTTDLFNCLECPFLYSRCGLVVKCFFPKNAQVLLTNILMNFVPLFINNYVCIPYNITQQFMNWELFCDMLASPLLSVWNGCRLHSLRVVPESPLRKMAVSHSLRPVLGTVKVYSMASTGRNSDSILQSHTHQSPYEPDDSFFECCSTFVFHPAVLPVLRNECYIKGVPVVR